MKYFQPDIFPFNFGVGLLSELPEIKKEFTDEKGDELDPHFPEALMGMVINALRKSKNGKSYSYTLILFREKPEVDDITHESFHAAQDLLESINIFVQAYQANETFAYTAGYIAKCISKTFNE